MPKALSRFKNAQLLTIFLLPIFILSFSLNIVNAATFTVSNSLDSGVGSLREAIALANTTAGADIIDFDSSVAPYSINLLSSLTLSDNAGVVIDAWSAGGSGYMGNPLVEINGSAMISGSALIINSANNIIRGMAFNRMANSAHAISITGAAASNNWLYGNYIGTDTSGTSMSQNMNDGVQILNGASNNLIGTNSDGVDDIAERNIIAGNRLYGIRIQSSDNNHIAGNYIGTDISGTSAICNGCTGIQNGGDGILLELGASGNIIGTDGDGLNDAVEGNLISGTVSSNNGVFIRDTGTDSNIVAGNLIGTNASGTGALANGGGISIAYGAQNNRIGTNGDGISDDLERNIISGNVYHGIQILESETDNNQIAGNYIGTDISGISILGNGTRGLEINTGPVAGGPSGNIIGNNNDGSVGEAQERNLISGNTGDGITIFGAGTDANIVSGNFIGTNATGTAALRNTSVGVRIYDGATNTEVYGTASVPSLISGNWRGGVVISDATTSGSLIRRNLIGTDISGTISISNQGDGVLVYLAGSGTELNSNIIANNFGRGVLIAGASPTLVSNTIRSNTRSGIYVIASYGVNSSPATAADDVISLPSINLEQINDNCSSGTANCAGIFLLDSSASNKASLELDNTIGTNNGANDIEQRWYGALEIISSGLPIASSAIIDSNTAGPSYTMSSSAACAGILDDTIIHGTAALICSNVSTWTSFIEFVVDSSGTRLNYSPQTISNPLTSYSFDADAASNPTNTGAGYNGEGITTAGFSRYQIMESLSPDPLPTVISTSPSDGESGVAENAKISINFSEDVTVTGTWYTINCSISGLHSATVSGGAQNYVLNPSVGFSAGESCTVTIAAAQVADQDIPIGNMALDYVFSFDIADAPPIVTATSPANGSSNNAANTNISISFSEMVTVVGAWFDINCSLSGNHTASLVGTTPSSDFELNPDGDFSFGEICTVTINAANVADTDAPIAAMAADYVFSFGIADAPPFIASTNPLDFATGIAVDSNIVIDFSEAVSLTGAWYSIDCATSGNHLAFETGIGTSFTLDPSSDFAFGELCTVTISAAQVQDLDAPLENMLADYSFSFTTMDSPPFVVSTSPVDFAIGIAIDSDIAIDFSEPVSLIGTWLTIVCSTSGSHSGLVTGGSQSYIVNPTTDFVSGETCTVSILASQVLDQDGTLSNMAADYQFSFSTVLVAGYASAPVPAGGSINFGNVLLGQTSSFTLTISEVGMADLDLLVFSISNPTFLVTSVPNIPTTIPDASNATVALTITCSPVSIGAISGNLSVTHNGTGAVANYTLSCIGSTLPATAMPQNLNNTANPALAIFDPAISKLGFLLPNELGLTGEMLEWQITIFNPSGVTGTNIIFSDTLRPELSIESVETSKGTVSITGQTVMVSIGSLAPAERVQMSIFTRVLNGSEIDNTACITADNLADERCVLGLVARELPATGEQVLSTFAWRVLFLVVVGLFLGILYQKRGKLQQILHSQKGS